MEKKKIWITWENQRRNRTLSQELNADLFEIINKRGRVFRYLICTVQTFKIINEKKPDILFVQNPSLALTLISIFLRKIFGFKLVVDAHNSGLYPLEGTSPLLNRLARFAAKSADFVIVTNSALANLVEAWGGRPLVLPDPLPNQVIKGSSFAPETGVFHVLFICTWSRDEPYLEVLKVAEELGEDFRISISGDWKGKVEKDAVPNNVALTGYLSDEDFIAKLEGAGAVLVLTTRDHCLNCGAYEAVAAEKPLVLSNKKEIRNYFSRGVVYAENEADSISQSLREVRENYDVLKKGITDLKLQINQDWVSQKELAEAAILTAFSDR